VTRDDLVEIRGADRFPPETIDGLVEHLGIREVARRMRKSPEDLWDFAASHGLTYGPNPFDEE
jgi:hypothetical protein